MGLFEEQFKLMLELVSVEFEDKKIEPRAAGKYQILNKGLISNSGSRSKEESHDKEVPTQTGLKEESLKQNPFDVPGFFPGSSQII